MKQTRPKSRINKLGAEFKLKGAEFWTKCCLHMRLITLGTTITFDLAGLKELVTGYNTKLTYKHQTRVNELEYIHCSTMILCQFSEWTLTYFCRMKSASLEGTFLSLLDFRTTGSGSSVFLHSASSVSGKQCEKSNFSSCILTLKYIYKCEITQIFFRR